VIRLAVLLYARFPLSLRNVADMLFGRGIGVCQETGRRLNNRVESLTCRFDNASVPRSASAR
jgi:transposase-like protein